MKERVGVINKSEWMFEEYESSEDIKEEREEEDIKEKGVDEETEGVIRERVLKRRVELGKMGGGLFRELEEKVRSV